MSGIPLDMVGSVPRVDVLRHPATSSWSVLPDLGAALAAIQSTAAATRTAQPSSRSSVLMTRSGTRAPAPPSRRSASMPMTSSTTFAPSTKAGAQTTIPDAPVRTPRGAGSSSWASTTARMPRGAASAPRSAARLAADRGWSTPWRGLRPAGPRGLRRGRRAASWSSPRWTRKGPTVVTHPASKEAVVAGTEDAVTVADAEARARRPVARAELRR